MDKINEPNLEGLYIVRKMGKGMAVDGYDFLSEALLSIEKISAPTICVLLSLSKGCFGFGCSGLPAELFTQAIKMRLASSYYLHLQPAIHLHLLVCRTSF